MKHTLALFVTFSACLVCSVWAQQPANERPANLPGWSVQLYYNGTPWSDLITQAFHFSPDGSFYESSDEEFQLKISTTIRAVTPISNHRIPIDAGCFVTVSLDGSIVRSLLNEHTFVEVDFPKGVHTLEIVNSCGDGASPNWMGIVVGACLWGTDNQIKFVKASVRPL